MPKNLARRERLNPDWPHTVFVFDCWPLGAIPQQLWDTAKLQQQLWNDLCLVFEAAKALDAPELEKETRKTIWAPTTDLKGLRAIAQQYKGQLPSACYYDVVDRFLITVKNWRKNPKLYGAPRKKFGLKKINIPLVFPEGKETTWLSENTFGVVAVRDTRGLKDSAPQTYQHNGRIEVGVERARLDLHVALHRPLPKVGRIKRVRLCGAFEPSLGAGKWDWQLQVDVEHPALEALPRTGRVAGLDLGWRVREDGLRIGYLTDNAGHRYEWRLPFVFANTNTRRRAEWAAAKGLPKHDLIDWREIAEMQAEEDGWLDACKEKLRALPEEKTHWPEKARRTFAALTKVRSSGLRRLLFSLREAGITDAVEILEAWEARAVDLRRWIRVAQLKAANQQKDQYRKLAHWLATHFDVIAWEGKLGLKEMAEDDPTDYALKNAQGYRQMASLYRLRLYIEQAMKKAGRELRDGGTAYSSQTCAHCGGVIEPSRKLLVMCENGHQWDQDANTSALFCKQIEGVASISEKAASIPDDLRRCLKIVPANAYSVGS